MKIIGMGKAIYKMTGAIETNYYLVQGGLNVIQLPRSLERL